jgi:cell division septation protein DedD
LTVKWYADRGIAVTVVWVTEGARRLLAKVSKSAIVAENADEANEARAKTEDIADAAAAVATDTAVTAVVTETPQSETKYDIGILAGSKDSFSFNPAAVAQITIPGASVTEVKVNTAAPTASPITKGPTTSPTTKQPTRVPTAQPTTAPTPEPTISWQSRFLFWSWIRQYFCQGTNFCN